MVVQFEDVVDVLKAIYGNTYDFLFFFDHSTGHDQSRPNGLNGNNMNKNYGGGQQAMRNSKIENHTYLRPYNHPGKLKVSEEQTMHYGPEDSGPFYLSEEERAE